MGWPNQLMHLNMYYQLVLETHGGNTMFALPGTAASLLWWADHLKATGVRMEAS